MRAEKQENLVLRCRPLAVLLAVAIPAITLLPGLLRKSAEVANAPDGFLVTTFAEQPLLSHPVAIAFDSQNRLYVVETNHFELEDLSGYREQLACRTVADGKRFYSAKPDQKSERIHRLEDLDDDGIADRSTVFADDFDLSDGIAAGVVAINEDLYFSNAPNLWRLTDANNDGVANNREIVHTGFGVRRKLLGHDLHGLIVGPDRKLYFSMGDRGLAVETDRGQISVANTGAILRCEPDGSNLEVFATGLRNAQELAFDAFGNLWTCDNNANRGDKSRWVYVVEGGDSGWRAAFQTLDKLGPFMQEGICDPTASVPFRVPPVGYVSEGPSGIACYPGTGLPAEFNDSFLLCDYMGSVLSVHVEPMGAGFRLAKAEPFIEVNAPTDVAFGDDGAIYVSDWVDTFQTNGQGRILRIQHPQTLQTNLVRQTQRLLRDGMKTRETDDLIGLLSHPDMRVRQRAQFELMDRGPTVRQRVAIALQSDHPQLARIHAIRILGAIAEHDPSAVGSIAALLSDETSEIRVQAAREIGDRGLIAASENLIQLLEDSEPRVQYFAAMSIGKLQVEHAFDSLLKLAQNTNGDAFLRHAVVMGLAGVGTDTQLNTVGNHASPAVRLASVLALRRSQNPRVADFLHDEDPTVVLAAARAIHDEPIDSALPALASLIQQPNLSNFVARRAINANFRLGGTTRAKTIAQFAAADERPEPQRVDALRALSDWATETNYDRVLGAWRPIPARDSTAAVIALEGLLPRLMKSKEQSIITAASEVATKLDITESQDSLLQRVADNKLSPQLRASALKRLARGSNDTTRRAVEQALESPEPILREAAVRCLVTAADAVPRLTEIARTDRAVSVRQAAIRTLSQIDGTPSDTAIDALVGGVLSGTVPASMHLEIIEAAEQHQCSQVRSNHERVIATRHRALLHGGDANTGGRLFVDSPAAQCRRCHNLTDADGKAGPSLANVGSRLSREEILSSIVSPNARIAKGFARVMLAMDDGTNIEGTIVSEDTDTITLRTTTGIRTIDVSAIDDRSEPTSAMPSNFANTLTEYEIRDLVEFLSHQRSKPHVTQARR